ncbi:MAG: DNA double-strand break repair nuclease NurA [Syntrophomonas sp.]
MFDVDTIGELGKLNLFLKSNKFCIPSREDLRRMLANQGVIKKTMPILEEDLREVTGNRSLVAVDGSRLEYGSFYPYYIVFMKSLAKSTRTSDGRDSIIDSQILTPVDPAFFSQVEEYSRKRQVPIDEAYRNLLKESLALMELKTALKAVRDFDPCLLIMDGGFLLFDKFPEWQELCEMCIAQNTILVGIIEEVATAELGKWFNLASPFRPRVYDREVLFGVFDPGEYIHFDNENRIKKNYCTVFARLASAPQACGCDFLPDQEGSVDKTMDFLYTITPRHGQSIPAWLQIVDAEVRLRKKEMDRVVDTCIDKDTYERYFKANRERRTY